MCELFVTPQAAYDELARRGAGRRGDAIRQWPPRASSPKLVHDIIREALNLNSNAGRDCPHKAATVTLVFLEARIACVFDRVRHKSSLNPAMQVWFPTHPRRFRQPAPPFL